MTDRADSEDLQGKAANATEATDPAPVFISYASQDKAVADAVCGALEGGRVACWIAPRDVTPGEFYAESIVHAIDSAKVIVLILSQNGAASQHVLREVERASSRRHPVVSFRIDAAQLPAGLEYFLNSSQWLDASATGVDRALPRLVDAVRRALALPSSAAHINASPAAAPRVTLRSTRMRIALSAIIAAALGYVVIDRIWLPKHVDARKASVTATPASRAGSSAAAAISDKSVAVLPLVNLSGDNKDSYLGDGISGEILSALSKLEGLKVIGRASSFQFRERDVDAMKVGRVLKVRSLLTGTVQRAGGKLRISVELIDTISGLQLWSQHFDRDFENLFTLEDDISNAVSAALAVHLGTKAGQLLAAAATENAHAHDLYLRARVLSFRSDEPSLNMAVELFNQAIAVDPNYAAAWAGLAYTYIWLCDAYRAPIDLLPVMKGAAEKAVALDPNLAEAHAYLGYIMLSYQRDFPAAEREVERAMTLNAGSADVRFVQGSVLLLMQQPASARAALKAAEELDPLNPFIPWAELWAATALGDSSIALQKAQRVLQIDPAFSYFTDPLVYAYGSVHRWQDCVARYSAVQADTRTGEEQDYMAAICYTHIGDNEHARHILAQLEAAARKRYVDHANLAEIYAALGEKDAAFTALEQAFTDRSQILLSVWFGTGFLSLHNDPRYPALMKRIYASLKVKPVA